MRGGEIQLQKVETMGSATPIARVGIERVSMKTDLIPPERIRAVLVESAKARLLNETVNLVCTNCWNYMEMLRVNGLPEKPACPRCGSQSIGLIKVEEEKALPLIEKRGRNLNRAEEKMQIQALQTSKLIAKYGKVAVIALSARKVQASDVSGVLEKEPKINERFYELILEAERKTLSKRFG